MTRFFYPVLFLLHLCDGFAAVDSFTPSLSNSFSGETSNTEVSKTRLYSRQGPKTLSNLSREEFCHPLLKVHQTIIQVSGSVFDVNGSNVFVLLCIQVVDMKSGSFPVSSSKKTKLSTRAGNRSILIQRQALYNYVNRSAVVTQCRRWLGPPRAWLPWQPETVTMASLEGKWGNRGSLCHSLSLCVACWNEL